MITDKEIEAFLIDMDNSTNWFKKYNTNGPDCIYETAAKIIRQLRKRIIENDEIKNNS